MEEEWATHMNEGGGGAAGPHTTRGGKDAAAGQRT